MVGILILAHSSYGSALIESVSHVLGQRPAHLLEIGISVRDDPQAVLASARDCVKELDEGDGVLVLSDILGATPSNIATRLVRAGHVEAVSGVNLPMLVRAITYRNKPLDMVVCKAMSGGTEGVVHVAPEPHDANGRS
jgi:PTS system ascorbate-specific IIA component